MIHSSFYTPWERIDEINATVDKTVSYLKTIAEFGNWVDANQGNLDVEEINSIYEDFVSSNEHIIAKINKILYPDNAASSYHPPCLSSSSTKS